MVLGCEFGLVIKPASWDAFVWKCFGVEFMVLLLGGSRSSRVVPATDKEDLIEFLGSFSFNLAQSWLLWQSGK